MSRSPAVNPNVHDIPDRAKHGYAAGTKVLAEVQYRLAELAGIGRIDPDESMKLQDSLVQIWEELYSGTLWAVRDEDTDDSTWDDADNSYSDGRTVMTQIRIEPWETSELNWQYNRFMSGEGAVNAHPRGTICYISHPNPENDRVVNDPPQNPSADFEDLRRRLLQVFTDSRGEADPAESDGGDGKRLIPAETSWNEAQAVE